MASTDSQIDKPQRGRPKRAELQDVNMHTGAAQSIYAESFFKFSTDGDQRWLLQELVFYCNH